MKQQTSLSSNTDSCTYKQADLQRITSKTLTTHNDVSEGTAFFFRLTHLKKKAIDVYRRCSLVTCFKFLLCQDTLSYRQTDV